MWTALLTRQGLALAALFLSGGAGIAFTVLLGWNVHYLQTEKQSEHLANLSYGMLLTLALIMFSLHRLLGSRQSIEAELWKFKFKLATDEAEEEAEGEAKAP